MATKLEINVHSIRTILTVILAATITLTCFASDAPETDISKIASYRKKIHSRIDDLFSIGKSTRSLEEKEPLLGVTYAGSDIVSDLVHIEELLQIKSVLRDEVDKQLISEYISDDIKFTAKEISSAIERVNINMAYLKSAAAVTEASKLKDDLHGLKELLQP